MYDSTSWLTLTQCLVGERQWKVKEFLEGTDNLYTGQVNT